MHPKKVSLLLAALLLAAGCVSNEPKPDPAPAPQAKVEAAPAPAPAPARPPCPPEDPKAKKKTATKKKGAEQPLDCEPSRPASPAATPAGAAQPVQPAAAAPAPSAAPAPRTGRVMHGPYDISNNKPVTESSQVQSGQGTMVKGERDWEGEITGVPAAGSTFTRLRIGMSRQQSIDLAGSPTDQGIYVTGKAWIPFYFGSDRTRWEMAYKGKGRLIFSQNSAFGTDYYLTWIIHNDKDSGYR